MINYHEIAFHYKTCLEKFGDTSLGLDWPNEEDMLKRYDVMLGLIRSAQHNVSLLDFGCGTSRLLDYINSLKVKKIDYFGLDINRESIDISKKKHPASTYYCIDILSEESNIPCFDYIVMNGLFTVKRSLTFDEMFNFMKQILRVVANKTNIGFAFNVMSKQVDWERDDLFHLSFDDLANFLVKEIGREFVIRNDYGLYEYTVYVYPNK